MPGRALFGVASRAELLVEALKGSDLPDRDRVRLYRHLLMEVSYGCLILGSCGVPSLQWQQVHRVAVQAEPYQILSQVVGRLPRLEQTVRTFAEQALQLPVLETPSAVACRRTPIPAISLHRLVLFPGTLSPVWLKHKAAAAACAAGVGGTVALFLQPPSSWAEPQVGVLAEVLQIVPYEDDAVIALVRASQRVRATPRSCTTHNICLARPHPWAVSAPVQTELLLRLLRRQLTHQIRGGGVILPPGALSLLDRLSLEEMLHLVGAYLPWDATEQQALLEAPSALEGGQILATRLDRAMRGAPENPSDSAQLRC